jgi:2-oxoglutarate ferredoxin oxidoreductase subunit alpha
MKKLQNLDEVTIRFAGDSGDGMQLTGMEFTKTTALFGNDLSTFPDYPAEIRAPAGTLFGVSGFQLHFGAIDIHTPGDTCDVLVAMNPASLKVNLNSLKDGGIIIANRDGFDAKNLKLAGYEKNPLEDGSLQKYKLYIVDITKLTGNVLADMNMSSKHIDRCKNFFALGMMYWMFNRSMEASLEWIQDKFKKTPEFVEANSRVLKAGYNYGETTEIFVVRYDVAPAKLEPGTYRSITGNEAVAFGLIAASVKSGLDLFLGTYPITPASDILHELSRHKNFRVKTFQAEDEIAAIASTIGAAYSGALAATTTSGPGLALKGEAIGLALMTELPLVIVNIQRGGPSTGLPTKTEQADLMQAMYGRNGEAPVCVIASKTPADCFETVFEACRIALNTMSPVIFLSDGYIANGAEPWKYPAEEDLPELHPTFRTEKEGYFPYQRDEKTLSRPWAIPGTPGLEHRIGGLEKANITGNVSYDAANHELMCKLRQEKVERIANDIPPAEIEGDESGDVLVVGWGGTYGAIKTAVMNKRREGKSVSHLHLRYLNPMQKNVGEILERFKHILVPELNLGQLEKVLRFRYLKPTISFNKIQGQPFKASELEKKIDEVLAMN